MIYIITISRMALLKLMVATWTVFFGRDGGEENEKGARPWQNRRRWSMNEYVGRLQGGHTI